MGSGKKSFGKNNAFNRDFWLENMLLQIPENSRILDAGAGTQQYRRFCNHLNYVSQDFGEYDGKGDDVALHPGDFDYGKLDIVSDIAAIPEPDASFDAVMCTEVFEHLPDPVKAVEEFSRLLKPGGHLVLTAPFCSLTHFAPYHFCSGFNSYWYETHLAGHGFKDIRIEKNGSFFEYLAQEVNRIRSVSKRYCGGRPNPLELINIFLLTKTLKRLSKKDTGSSELLFYGCHVHARKAG
jgi:SAM-dependent methyltransferase